MTTDINSNGDKSIFVRVDKGVYILRTFLNNQSGQINNTTDIDIPTLIKPGDERIKIINSFGIYWNRNFVHWKSTKPNLLGIQQIGASEVNFKDQIGIYLLHDSRETIYVGQAVDQPLGKRLKDHTSDRLSGRWDRFSWFGLRAVHDNGELQEKLKFENLSIQDIGDILEAILIESIEPRQNRKQGNLFFGLEYLQQEAPEIKKKMKEQLLKELTDKL